VLDGCQRHCLSDNMLTLGPCGTWQPLGRLVQARTACTCMKVAEAASGRCCGSVRQPRLVRLRWLTSTHVSLFHESAVAQSGSGYNAPRFAEYERRNWQLPTTTAAVRYLVSGGQWSVRRADTIWRQTVCYSLCSEPFVEPPNRSSGSALPLSGLHAVTELPSGLQDRAAFNNVSICNPLWAMASAAANSMPVAPCYTRFTSRMPFLSTTLIT
jgi:hypothetical protein